MSQGTLRAVRSPGISRYESKGTTGWLARFYATDRVVQRLFSDSRYAYAPEASLAAARTWLQTCLTQWEPRPRYRRTPAKSNTRCVGICLRTKRERNGATFLVYDVSYSLQGTRHTKSFRVHQYTSQQEALAAAQQFRRAMERAMQRERRDALRQSWTQAREQEP